MDRPTSLWPLDPELPGIRTRIIGHRGLPHQAPENTLASLAAAERAGADIVEVDVKVTQDGTLVLMHDETVDRTTDGSGPVGALTLAEVRALRADGEPIPTLAEAIVGCGRPLMVDYGRVGEARALLTLLADPALRARVMLTGGSVEGHALLRAAYPDLAIAFSTSRPALRGRLWEHAAESGAQYVNPYHLGLGPAFVARAHEHGFGVSTWTVDHTTRMRRLVDLGIDLLITNRADLAVRVRSDAGRAATEVAGA
jgi:glycerophosphoryl diester phosphodiesterase